RNTETPARVSLTAIGPDGSPYFRGRVPDASPSAAVSTAAQASQVSFEVQPGTIQLRMSVESAAADVLDSETREIVVPDLTLPQVAIGTPEVFRARTIPQ